MTKWKNEILGKKCKKYLTLGCLGGSLENVAKTQHIYKGTKIKTQKILTFLKNAHKIRNKLLKALLKMWKNLAKMLKSMSKV